MIVFSALFFGLLTALPPDVKPDLLPGVGNLSDNEIELAGLASLYPGRVLHGEPQTGNPGNAGRPPMARDLPGSNITYVRVYDLAAAIPKVSDLLEKQPALIIDLRYVYGDTTAADAFAHALAKAGLESAPLLSVGNIAEPPKPPDTSDDSHQRPPVVLVLVNGQTAGPLEACLAAFQEKESVPAVGTPTAGQPGQYQVAEGAPAYSVMIGEWRPASGSIAGAGLPPRFAVDVTPEQNYRAYNNLESGVDIANLLRPSRAAAPATPSATAASATGNTTTSGNTTPSGNTTANPPAAAPAAPVDDLTDAVLQRAVDVVAALQVLNPTPSSSPSGASSGTTARPAAGSAPASTQP